MATKKNIADVPQTGTARRLLGVDEQNKWVTVDGDITANVPYTVRLIDVATVSVDRPLESGVEFALFRRSVSVIKRAEGRSGYDTKGWKMCRRTNVGDVNIARQFPAEKAAKMNYYTFRGLNKENLIGKFAAKTKDKSGNPLLRVYNNKYAYDLYGKAFPTYGAKQATLKLAYCLIRKITDGRTIWNGRYEILSNMAKFKLILPRVYDQKYMADMELGDALGYAYIKPI